MTDYTPTFTFEGETIFAIHEGKVIASGTDMADVESDAVEYLDSLKTTRDEVEKENARKSATHIITPNGVKGEILNRTPDLWGGEELTIRLANGSFAQYSIHGESKVEWVKEQPAIPSNPATALKERLASTFERDRDSLQARLNDLQDISLEARRLASSGAPYPVEVALDQVRVAADIEAHQIKEAIEHLDAADAESFIPEAPFRPSVVEQADLGKDNSWLDVTAQEMIAESEGEDFDAILSEGPSLLTAELDTGALADAGVTREMAYAHIISKTAGFTGQEIADYRDQFVARTEVARRHELAARKETMKREAAVEEQQQVDTRDEALFF